MNTAVNPLTPLSDQDRVPPLKSVKNQADKEWEKRKI